jgi:hypothetical protein
MDFAKRSAGQRPVDSTEPQSAARVARLFATGRLRTRWKRVAGAKGRPFRAMTPFTASCRAMPRREAPEAFRARMRARMASSLGSRNRLPPGPILNP